MSLIVTPFYDAATHAFSYVVAEPASGACAVIDAVLDYDLSTAAIKTRAADRIVAFVKANDLIVEWLLETHVHEDHLSAMAYLQTRFVCAQRGVSAAVESLLRLRDSSLPDTAEGRFDRLFSDGDRISLGHACGRVLATPGHTSACVSYRFENLLFVGDTLLMPDVGTGRCDLPGGDASMLYASIRRILSLPERTRLFVCHDEAPADREVQYLSTVREQRDDNILINAAVSEEQFLTLRGVCDAQLENPTLLDPALAFNLSGGSSSTLPRPAGSQAA